MIAALRIFPFDKTSEFRVQQVGFIFYLIWIILSFIFLIFSFLILSPERINVHIQNPSTGGLIWKVDHVKLMAKIAG